MYGSIHKLLPIIPPILDDLTASEVASLEYALRLENSGWEKWKMPYRDIVEHRGWIKEMLELGHKVLLIGSDARILADRIKVPNDSCFTESIYVWVAVIPKCCFDGTRQNMELSVNVLTGAIGIAERFDHPALKHAATNLPDVLSPVMEEKMKALIDIKTKTASGSPLSEVQHSLLAGDARIANYVRNYAGWSFSEAMSVISDYTLDATVFVVPKTVRLQAGKFDQSPYTEAQWFSPRDGIHGVEDMTRGAKAVFYSRIAHPGPPYVDLQSLDRVTTCNFSHLAEQLTDVDSNMGRVCAVLDACAGMNASVDMEAEIIYNDQFAKKNRIPVQRLSRSDCIIRMGLMDQMEERFTYRIMGVTSQSK